MFTSPRLCLHSSKRHSILFLFWFSIKVPNGKQPMGMYQNFKVHSEGYSSELRISTATILGLPDLFLLGSPAWDNSQRSIRSSAEILGDASAFRSHSARGSRDCKREWQSLQMEFQNSSGWRLLPKDAFTNVLKGTFHKVRIFGFCRWKRKKKNLRFKFLAIRKLIILHHWSG